jgi:hypothetical protein
MPKFPLAPLGFRDLAGSGMAYQLTKIGRFYRQYGRARDFGPQGAAFEPGRNLR